MESDSHSVRSPIFTQSLIALVEQEDDRDAGEQIRQEREGADAEPEECSVEADDQPHHWIRGERVEQLVSQSRYTAGALWRVENRKKNTP